MPQCSCQATSIDATDRELVWHHPIQPIFTDEMNPPIGGWNYFWKKQKKSLRLLLYFINILNIRCTCQESCIPLEIGTGSF